MNKILYILITVDVEDSQRPEVVHNTGVQEQEMMVYGKINNNYYGFLKIIEICNASSISANFFVDIYEFEKYGKNSLRTICQEITKNGHEVQLHTHPIRAYDPKREHMWEYSLFEQVEIIKDGKKLIKEWTGESPIAHRAGAYGIDENTLIALKENNIPIDSSMFYGHKNCKVNWSKNRIVEKNGIIEVPITIFRRNRYINLRLCNIKKGSQYVKTDIDWANLEELKFFVQEAKKNNVRVMNLFMHSYSFVKFDKNFTRFEPDYKDIEKFEKFLRFISKDEAIRVITLKEFYKMYRQESAEFLGSDHVPVVDYVERFNPIKNSVSAGKSIIRKLVKSA